MRTGRRLILNDGTVIENGEAGQTPLNLWLWFGGMTLQEAAALFFDTEKTETITFQYGEMEDIYEGYTSCARLEIDTDGKITVCMKRGE